MSETTSSPSVQPHPISPSSESSLSSTDSAPRSEPTSDEQPDLGAFTTVLREWTHLQPGPRIPVQIRSATSSTTPTFQPEQSIVGSDYGVDRGRTRNSRTSNRSGFSTLSSFTRPPSSSIQPEGSTVWNQALIASYLNSATPSNDIITEEDEENERLEESEYTPSPPPSRASTALTVEITSEVDFPSFDGSRDSSRNQLDPSPFPDHMEPDIYLPIPVESDGQRLDSRETAHRDGASEEGSLALNDSQRQDSSPTSRDLGRRDAFYTETSSLQSHSPYQSQAELTSIQLQSQAHAPTTIATSSESPFLPIQDPGSSILLPSTSYQSVPQMLTAGSNSGSASVHSSGSTSTLITALRNRTRNPLPPRTISDTSVATTGSALSSDFSLISYQIPETPPITNDDEAEPAQGVAHSHSSARSQLNRPQAVPNQFTSSSTSLPSTSAASATLSLKTQKSVDSSTSSDSQPNFDLATVEQAQSSLLRPFHPSVLAHVPSLSSNESPLPNPYSPIPPRGDGQLQPEPLELPLLSHGRGPTVVRHFDVVNDLGTPVEQPSELGAYKSLARRTRADNLPVDDIEDDEVAPELKRDLRRSKEISAAEYPSDRDTAHGIAGPSVREQSALKPLVSERIPHVESQFDEDEDDREEDYPYRYPYTYTPGSHSQAITPKGLPTYSSSIKENTSTQTHSFLRPLEHFSQSFSQLDVHAQASRNLLSNVQQLTDIQPLSQLPKPVFMQSTQDPASRTSAPNQHLSAEPSHSHLYPFTSAHSVGQPSSSTRAVGRSHRHQTAHDRQGYPHSLIGLHALPASLVSPDPECLPPLDIDTSSFSARMSQPLVEPDSRSETAADEEEEANQPLPSLGYLDEALSFIAAERAKWRAARQLAGGTVSDSQVAGGGGSEDEVEAPEDGIGIPNIIDNEQDHPKRKRRRKRPPRSHGLAPGTTASTVTDSPATASIIDDNASAQFLPGSSPKKKRRSKSASASTSSRSLLIDSPNKSKLKARARDKEFLIAPRATPAKNVSKDGPPVTILQRPIQSDMSDKEDMKTPTNVASLMYRTVSEVPAEGSVINLVGKKGKRVGRREREREKKKKDLEHEQADKKEEERISEDFSIEVDYDDGNEDEDDGVEPQEDEDDHEENDSLSNMALLQPPRRKRDRSRRRRVRDAHIHNLISNVGEPVTYKSTPTTPMRPGFSGREISDELDVDTGLEVRGEPGNPSEDDVFLSKPNEGPSGEKKKRARPKRAKTLTHSRSDPQLHLDSDLAAPGDDSSDIVSVRSKKGKLKAQGEIDKDSLDKHPLSKTFTASSASSLPSPMSVRDAPPTFPPESKRGRLLALAKKLSQLFPEQREELNRVIARIERQGAVPITKSKKALSADVVADYGIIKSSPVAIPGVKGRKPKKSHFRSGSEGAIAAGYNMDDQAEDDAMAREERVRFSGIEEEEAEEEIDPRGRPPKKNDVLIHVFIDHSNILIGLLSYLKRHPPQRKVAANTAARGRPLPAVVTKATTSTNDTEKTNPLAAFAAVKPTSARPLPVPIQGEASSSKQADPPIPLPSFATLSRSLPTTSVLGFLKPGKNSKDQYEKETNSDSHGYTSVDHDDDEAGGTASLFVGSFKNNEKKPPKHLWHAALALILERGRPVTRRVVVTSSPLYQPMESIERLGYELRVFIRVPDLGDGMDRERHRDKDRGGSGKSSGGKSSQSSPVTTTSLSTLAKRRSIGHTRQLSGNTSAESGSGGANSGNASGGAGGHPSGAITSNGTPQKIKYREQGVDELLQLKLHQALAATDDVPEGSTIVLATGDGNMGQFNEEGFLGPVRTALRRGWKVELYAWEDGLSRAWRREFGAGSEWSRRGMFRIIGMEQFASGLVEASGWS